MENMQNNNEKRTYVRPEAELFTLRLQENIAASGSDETSKVVIYEDEFDGEDDVFD